ncbi:MAG: hypothetical protein FWE36_02375 [Erysipelotrichales bacterium]|nr:hypothetical protein [Erysipelotrichales bacterium]
MNEQSLEVTKNSKATPLRKIIIVFLVIAIIIIGIALIIQHFFGLRFDRELGKAAFDRSQNAQYLPEIERLAGVEGFSRTRTAQLIDINGFVQLQERLGIIDTPHGAGSDYDIFAIREEIGFVLENVPAFNQWFRIGSMRSQQGFAAIPNIEGFSFFLEANEDASVLTITRISWRTGFNYFNFETQSSSRDHQNGVHQFQVMQTKYYYDEQGREVVEVTVFDVGIAHGNYYPLNLQYIRNVRDTSLTRFNVSFAYRLRHDEMINGNPRGSDNGGADLRGLNPLGDEVSFLYLNYENPDDTSLLQIRQIRPIANLSRIPETTAIMFYHKTLTSSGFFAQTHDYLNNLASGLPENAEPAGLLWIQRNEGNIDIAESFINSSGAFRSISWLAGASNITLETLPQRIRSEQEIDGDEQQFFNALFSATASLAETIDLEQSKTDTFLNQMLDNPMDLNTKTNIDAFILILNEKAISEVPLIENWASMYSDSGLSSRFSITVPEINLTGPHDFTTIPMSHLRGTVDIRDGYIRFDMDADIINLNFHNNNYFLGLALRNNETGNHLLLNHLYQETLLSSGGGWNTMDTRGTASLVGLNLTENSSYTLVYVLANIQKGIVFETLVNANRVFGFRQELDGFQIQLRNRNLLVVT